MLRQAGDAGRLLGVSLGRIGFVLTFRELLLLMAACPLCFSRLEARSGKKQ